MPYFYFDVRENDSFVRDDDGTSLPDVATAQREAADAAVEIAQDSLPERGGGSVTLEVRDESGEQVLSVTVTMNVTRSGTVLRS
jgi:hypothetical protein